MFCKNCGTELKDGPFCPACGMENVSETPESSDGNIASAEIAAKPAEKHKLLIKCIAVIVAIVIVLIAISSLTGRGSATAKDAVKNTMKFYKNASYSALLDNVPKDLIKDMKDEFDISYGDIKKAVKEYAEEYEDDMDDSDSKITKIKYTDKETADDDDLEMIQTAMNLLEFYFDLDHFDTDKIKKAVTYETEITTKTDGEKDTDTSEFVVIRYKGDWYEIEAMTTVLDIVVEEYGSYSDVWDFFN